MNSSMSGSQTESDRSLIARHDSTLSAMRCLLESSQEPSPTKHCPPADTPNSRTEGNDADVSTVSESASPENAVSESLSSQSQDTALSSQSQDTDVTETDSQPILDSAHAIKDPPEESSQDDSRISKSPEDKKARANDHLDHAEHVAIVLSQVKNRFSLRTRAPRLWRHGCQIFD